MLLAHRAEELRAAGRKFSLAIGFFDGVHLGHRQIIRQMTGDARQRDALAVVLTFDRHPNSVVAPELVPPLIYSVPQKQRAIAALGPDALWEVPFDEPFSRLSAAEFVRRLVAQLGEIAGIWVGANFAFGHRRTGNVALLKRLGEELGFQAHGLAAVALGHLRVSSTGIRRAISAGELDLAGEMLGRRYSLAGKVVRGDALGRQLGFPTANLDTAGLVLPPAGIYAVQAETADHRYRAVMSIGFRPTLKDRAPRLQVEVHLLEFSGDLYGREIEVFPVRKLREEQAFDSLDELKAQISRDILSAQAFF